MYPLGKPSVAMFRGLVIVEIVLTVLLTFVVLAVAMVMAEPQAEELTTSDAVGMLSVLMSLVVFFPSYIAAWVGMLLLKNWGRWTYLITWILSQVVYFPLSFAQVASGPEVIYVISGVTSTLTGLIIAIAFYSPVSHSFVAAPMKPASQQVYDVD